MNEPSLKYDSVDFEEPEDDLDDSWYEGQVWRRPEDVIPEEEPILLARAQKALPVLPKVMPSQFAQFAFRFPTLDEEGLGSDKTGYDRFSFEGRRHMRRLYDTPAKRILLFCGRQVEKCLTTCFPHQVVLLPNGMGIPAFDVQVGQELVSYDEWTGRTCVRRVVAKKKVGAKPCVRIATRQGHELRVATTHPILTSNGWVEAQDLEIGHRVGAIRRGGSFTCRVRPDVRWVKLCPYLIADGGLGTSGYLAFTKKVGVVKDDFMAQLTGPFSADCRTYDTSGEGSQQHRLSNCVGLKDKLKQVGLWGCYSKDKFIPAEVFDYSRKNTALFLNRLWSCDGSVKKETSTKYSIEYASISYRLVRQVQHLLWKFGIPTSYRNYQPKTYEGTDKLSHIIRVETRSGIRRFLTEIGALGKSEGVPLPDESIPERNNRDTIPAELVRRYVEAALPAGKSLRKAGIERFPRSGVTQDRVRTLIESLLSVGAKKKDVALLDALLDSDLYWDEVERIEELGKESCFDIEVEDTHNFLLSGVFTHNSTLLGNRAICYMSLVKDFRVLYVSASATQAKKFSADRVREPIETSPVLKKFTTTMLSSNILEKQFVNRSQITMRYAYLNADRCLHGDSRIQMADGSLRTIRELAEDGAPHTVVTAREDGSLFVAVATDAHHSGKKRVVKVVTDYPVDLYCSYDHPLRTGRGWVKAEELLPTDFVAAPHILEVHRSESIGEDWAWLIGAMIAEGECSKKTSVRFTNSDESYLNEFIERACRVGIFVGDKVEDNREGYKTCWSVGLYSDRKGPGLTGAKLRLWELGEFGDKASSKKVPRAIWKAPLYEKAAFLWALFCGDGWCSPDNGGARAGYSSSSKRLVEDLAILLWNVGIRSSIYPRPPSTDGAGPSWTVSLSKRQTEKLIDLIGPFRDCPVEPTRTKDDTDRIPITYLDLREHLRERYGLSTHSAWGKYRIQLRPGNVHDSVGRRVLQTIADKLQDTELLLSVDEHKSWVRVRSIEEVGVDDVYDLTVDGFGCFIAGGLVVHNTRGIPADLLCIDEFQDILGENIPVIEQCLAHGRERWKMYLYAGTPKSFDNNLEKYWSSYSTQNEWVVPHDCKKGEGGRYWNEGLGEKNIGKRGLICANCGVLIDPMCEGAQWAMTGQPDADFEGYRIPQLMVPWVDWKHDIILNYDRYPRDKFYNEVLGLSYDSGLRPLTRAQVRDCCVPDLSMEDIQSYRQLAYGQSVYAGIDWGSGENSYTVIVLATYIDMKFRIFFAHRFVGEETDPDVQLERIKELIAYFNVKLIGCDYGGGYDRNHHLVRAFGPKRVWTFQHLGRVKRKVEYDPRMGRFKVSRAEVMGDIFNAIKRRRCEFPRWEEWEDPFAQDMLNIFGEFNETLRIMQYKHATDNPDDTFHSLMYAWLVSMLEHPRPDIITPNKEINGQIVSQYAGPLDQD